MKVGDRLPVLAATLLDVNGSAIDLTGLTVDFHMRKVGATALTATGTCTVVSPTAGTVTYAWAAGDTATAGDYEGEFQINYSGSRTLTVPNQNSFPIVITPALG